MKPYYADDHVTILFREAARTTEPDEWIRLIEAANRGQRAARAELRVAWIKE